MAHAFTRHAKTRMKQRGLRKKDVEILLETAEQVAPDAYLMTNAIVEEQIACRRQEIRQLERLRGKKLVVEGGAVITAYHASERDQAKTLRKGRAFA